MIKKNFLFTAFAIFIGYTSIANAQTSFVQSRYLDKPLNTACSSCQLGDGIVHIRFKPGSAVVSGGKVEFTAQMRKTGEASRGITSGVFRLAFDEEVFGAQLNTPPIASGNTPADGGQCTFTRSDLFISGTKNYNIFFGDSAGNQLGITEQHLLAIVTNTTAAPPTSFAFLSNEWQDMVTLSCTIPSGQEASDAGFAVHGSEPLGTTIAEFPQSATDRLDRTAILVADNDMRGLRLDGKTWAEDYVRYGDGKGVRLKFSKSIKTQLTADSFDLTADGASTTPTITRVLHTAGEAYAQVEFMEAIVDGTLRLSDASIMDVDDEALASGNFLAALNYDEDAPQVTAAAKDSTAIVGGNNHSTWSIDFSSGISTATLDISDICVTESNGLCVAEGETPSVPVVSVSVSGSGTEMELVINEGDGKVGGVRSLEFRRNAVLGADFKVVEDYQMPLRNAVEIEDTEPPVISITAATAVADSTDPLQYTITFTVQADEPVPTLNAAASYQLLRVLRADGSTVNAAGTPTITGDDREVDIQYTYTFADKDELGLTSGFTLARAGTSLQDTAGKNPKNKDDADIEQGGRIDDSIAITDQPLTCAAFYPYINQTEIFLRVKSDTLNMGGFAYTDAGGVRVMATQVERVSSIPEDDIYIVKIIREEIGNVDSIEVSYTSNGTEESATCEASISEDTDEDGIVDIVDSNPFNETVDAINPQTGGVLATAPMGLNAFYSRKVLIRNIVRGDLTAMEYFGIGTPDAKAFNKNSGCQFILDAAVSLNDEGTVHLTGVNIVKHCGTEVTNMFGDEPAGVQSYAWVQVNENGRLSSRPFHVNGVNVIPEINFAGQSSYLLAIPTESQEVTISAYVKGTAVENDPVTIEVVTSSDVAGVGSDPASVTLAVDDGLIADTYIIGRGLISAGHSATYQLMKGDVDTTYPAIAITTRTIAEGHDLSSYTHTIGPNNTIRAKVVEHEKEIEQIIEVHNILLYDITGFSGQPNSLVQANRLVSGREYVLVADYTPTTTHDITRMVPDPSDYVEKPEDENSVTFPLDHRHRNGTHYASIEFTVADITDTRAIVVGWDNIGSVEPVVATYLAVSEGDGIIVDEDLDGIPDVYDDVSDLQALQSFAASDTGMMGNVLRVTRDMQEAFMSDVGRNMAILIGGSTTTQWTAANISHAEVIASIQNLGITPEDVALSFIVTEDPIDTEAPMDTEDTEAAIDIEVNIEKLATFGVRDVEPAVDNDQMIGGVAYVTFPMQSAADTIYIGKYNSNDDTWYRFERGGIEIDGESYDDTWYAIDRGAADAHCPTDIEVYKNEHRAAGENNLGFNRGTDGWNCIMAVLTDGGPYDSDGSVNGRVIDPIATVTNLLSEQEFISDGGPTFRGGGGGGAIGIFDMLLFITALLLLMVAGTQRRKLLK